MKSTNSPTAAVAAHGCHGISISSMSIASTTVEFCVRSWFQRMAARPGSLIRSPRTTRLPIASRSGSTKLEVVYRFDIDASEQRFGSTPGLKLRRMDPRSSKLMSRPDGFPEVVHPLVFRQPETGRKVLNVSPWFAMGVEGMDGRRGRRLAARSDCTRDR